MQRSTPTQLEIAKAAGVSQRAVASVVGRATTAGTRVSAETRERILKVANELGYRPQRQAQLLRGVKSGMIGMLKGVSLLQSGVEKAYFTSQAVHRAGYDLFTQELLWHNPKELERTLGVLIDAKVEGVLIGGGVGSETFEVLRGSGIPVVTIGEALHEQFHCVGSDLKGAMRSLVYHLHSQGCRKLAFEVQTQGGKDTHNWSVRQRVDGFYEACRELGLPKKDSQVIWQPWKQVDFDYYEAGRQTAVMLLKKGNLPDALLCLNDQHAVGALNYFQQHGLDIPRELMLAGFDDSALSRHLSVPLTTVKMPVAEIANEAVDLLVRLIQKDERSDITPKTKLLPCELIVRNSSAGINRNARLGC